MEVEFIACHETTSQVIWLQNFMAGLKIIDSMSKPMVVYCNNYTAVYFAKNNKSSSKSKHIELKYHVMHERIQQ